MAGPRLSHDPETSSAAHVPRAVHSWSAATPRRHYLLQGKARIYAREKGWERRPSPYARSSLRAASALGNHGEGEGFLRGVWLPAPARQVWWRRPLRVRVPRPCSRARVGAASLAVRVCNTGGTSKDSNARDAAKDFHFSRRLAVITTRNNPLARKDEVAVAADDQIPGGGSSKITRPSSGHRLCAATGATRNGAAGPRTR